MSKRKSLPPKPSPPPSRWALFAIGLALAVGVAVAATLTRPTPEPVGSAPAPAMPTVPNDTGASADAAAPPAAAGAADVEAFGNLQFEIPRGWGKFADVSALVYVPPGEQPPDLPYGGIKSVGIVVAEPMRFADDSGSLEDAWGKVLDEDPTLIKRGTFQRVKASQPDVEALSVEVQMKQDAGVFYVHSVGYRLHGSLTQVSLGAVDEGRYRKYAPAFQHFLETVRVK